MKITKLSPQRLLLEFPTTKEMTLSNFRISEFKEGKEGIKGKMFTADQFIDKYSDDKGNIDYFSYWEGFNYSISDLSEFYHAFFGNISDRENKIVECAKQINENGYIICMVEGDEITLKHETAHAIFFENKEYCAKVKDIISTIDLMVFMDYQNALIDMDYGQDCLIDEMHAYLVAYDEDEFNECFPLVIKEHIIQQRDKLQDLFDCYNK